MLIVVILSMWFIPILLIWMWRTSEKTRACFIRIVFKALCLMGFACTVMAMSLVHNYLQLMALVGWVVGLSLIAKGIFFPTGENDE